MDCKEFQERLDLYVDGELAAEVAEEMRGHLKGCASCAKAEAGLRHLRLSLRRVVNRHQPPQGFELKVLRPLRAGRRGARAKDERKVEESRRAWAHVWGARVVVPVPFLALLVLSVFALAGWLVFARRTARRPAQAVATRQGEFDLSRYYGGERASIQVVRRAAEDERGR